MSNDKLETEAEYLKNTIACLKGENAALKAELAQQSHNSAMTKLPELAECLSQLDFAEGDPVAGRVVDGVKVVYEFMARQMSA